MTDELLTIGVKFQAFVFDNFKPHQTAKEQVEANPAEEKQKILNRYLLAQSLIKDMVTFVTCCSRKCSKLLTQRKDYFERASETKDMEDRVRLKIFDERSFSQMHRRMVSLKSFVEDFCNLFESDQSPSDQQETSVVSPAKEIST